MLAARALVVVVFCAPLVFMLLGALRGLDQPVPTGFDVVPDGTGVGAFRELAQTVPLGRLFRNSIIVVAIAVPVTTLVASWAGFGMAVLGGRAGRLLVTTTVGLLVLPVSTVWVARFVLYRNLGLLESLGPLIAPAFAATTPFTVLLAYRAFRKLPPALWEAARVEGASPVRTWWSIGLPLVRPTTAAIAAIAFTFHWGNYLDALLYIQRPSDTTLAVGIGQLRNLDPSDSPVALAGALLLAAVPLLLLAAVQRRLFEPVPGADASA